MVCFKERLRFLVHFDGIDDIGDGNATDSNIYVGLDSSFVQIAMAVRLRSVN